MRVRKTGKYHSIPFNYFMRFRNQRVEPGSSGIHLRDFLTPRKVWRAENRGRSRLPACPDRPARGCQCVRVYMIYAHMCNYSTGDRTHGDTMPEQNTTKTHNDRSAAPVTDECTIEHTCMCGETHVITPEHTSNRDTCTSTKKFGSSCCCSADETESEVVHICGHKPRCH
jgi:hypothetical protein